MDKIQLLIDKKSFKLYKKILFTGRRKWAKEGEKNPAIFNFNTVVCR